MWIADLTASDLGAPSFVDVAVGLDAETGAWVARDGRLYVHTNLDAPARPDRGHRPDGTRRRALDHPARRGPDGGPRGRGVHRRRRGRHARRPCCSRPGAGTPSPRSARTTPRTGERLPDAVTLPGLGSISGLVDATRRRPGDLVLLHGPHDAHERAPVRRAHRRRPPCGRRLPGSSPTCRTSARGRSRSPAPTAPPCARSSSPAPTRSTPTAARWPPRRRSSTATAGSRSRSTRRSRRPRSRGWRPAACTSSPTCAAAARRARSGTAPACGPTSRTCSTTSTPSATTSSRRAGPPRTSWRAGAAPTAACSSAPR